MLCCRVQNLLSAYCDRELTGAEMLRIRSHLDACPTCRREHAALLQVKALLGALSSADPETPFRPAMLDAAPTPHVSRLARAAGLVPRARHLERLRELFAPAALLLTLRRWSMIAVPRGQAFAAVAGSFAVAVLAVSLVQKPQAPDAVDVHVGESIALAQVMPADADPAVAAGLRDPYPIAAVRYAAPSLNLAHYPGGSGRIYSGYAVPVRARPAAHFRFGQPAFPVIHAAPR